MKRLTAVLAVTVLIATLGSGIALAQSSGSFNYNLANATTACTVNSGTGAITGGVSCGPLSVGGSACTVDANCPAGETCSGQVACSLFNQTPCTNIGETCNVLDGVCNGSGICSGAANTSCTGGTDVTIKTNSGNDNVFVVRPSAVVALLTDVTVNSKQPVINGAQTSSAYAGVDFQVSLNKPVPGGLKTKVIPDYWVTYDARFIQISTNLFQAIATQCQAIAGGCFLTFNESTASAHSFDWIVAPLTAGDYNIHAAWKSSLADSGIAESETCVGPVNLTIQQNKIFEPSEGSLSTVSF